jgi:hypothetical protein
MRAPQFSPLCAPPVRHMDTSACVAHRHPAALPTSPPDVRLQCVPPLSCTHQQCSSGLQGSAAGVPSPPCKCTHALHAFQRPSVMQSLAEHVVVHAPPPAYPCGACPPACVSVLGSMHPLLHAPAVHVCPPACPLHLLLYTTPHEHTPSPAHTNPAHPCNARTLIRHTTAAAVPRLTAHEQPSSHTWHSQTARLDGECQHQHVQLYAAECTAQ